MLAGVDVDRWADLPPELVPWKPLDRWAQVRDAALGVPPTHPLAVRLESRETWRLRRDASDSEARRRYFDRIAPLVDAGPVLFAWRSGDGPGHVSPFHTAEDFHALRRLAWAPFLRSWHRNARTGPYHDALEELSSVVLNQCLAVEVESVVVSGPRGHLPIPRHVMVSRIVEAFDDLAEELARWHPPAASVYVRTLDGPIVRR